MKKKPMSEKRVTIKDVALRAGVSIGAVSRVLHGRASTIRVSEATSEVIRKAAKDLNYKPNRSAQSLRSGRTRSITVAAPFEISFASNPYYASILDSILEHAATKGYTVCLSKASVNGAASFEDSKGKFDGIIWLGTPTAFSESDSKLEELPQVGIHLEDTGLPEKLINIKADEVQAIINYVGHLRVNDVSKIGLFAKSGDSAGLLSDKQLQDLCKRIAIDYIAYKSVDEVPALAQKAGIDAGLVWHLEDAANLSGILDSKKPNLAPIITDAKAAKGSAFVFPINEMVRTAIETLTAKIENPQAVVASVALPIPAPE